MRITPIALTLFAAAQCFIAPAAHAVIVSASYSGIVYEQVGLTGGAGLVGSRFTFSVTYDSDTLRTSGPGITDDPRQPVYYGAIKSITMNGTAVSTVGSSMIVLDNFGSASTGYTDAWGFTFNFDGGSFSVGVDSTTSTPSDLIASPALPTSPLDPGLFIHSGFGINLGNNGFFLGALSQSGHALGTLDPFEAPVAQTPLPAALPLFASGLGALWFAARRRTDRSAAIASR